MNQPFCNAPWNSLHVDATGNIRPCCVSSQVLGNVTKNNSLTQAYQSQELSEIRHQMLLGKPPESCQICIKKDAQGFDSRKTVYSPVALAEGEKLDRAGDPRFVYMLDVTFSNICNLKCRFCGPFCSSKWIEDSKKLPANDSLWRGHKSKDWSIFHFKAEDMMAQVNQFTNLQYIDVNGGEPFMSTEHLRFLQLLVKAGRAQDISMIYTTNGTILNPDFLESLAHFKDVKIAISSEGIGNVYRYSRGHEGAEKQLEAAFEFFTRNKNTRLGLNYTISAINIFGITDFLNWFEPLKNKFNIDLTYDVVVAPDALKIQNLPLWFRQKAADLLPQEHTPMIDHFRKVITEGETTPQNLALFWKFVDTLDQLQKCYLTEMQPIYKQIEPLNTHRNYLVSDSTTT